MKANKFTLMAMALLGGWLAFAPVASVRADDTTTNAAPKIGARGERMQQMMEKLELTPEQKAQLKPVMKSQREKMMALRDDDALTPEAKRAKMKEIMEGTAAKMKTILTPAQFTKWEEMRKQARPYGGAKAADGAAAGNSLLPTTPTP